MKTPKPKRITISIDPDLLAKVDKVAEDYNLTRSEVISRATTWGVDLVDIEQTAKQSQEAS